MSLVNYKMQVLCNGSAEVKSTSSIVSTVVGQVGNGTILTADAQENGWYHHDKGGWTNGQYLIILQDLSSSTVNSTTSMGTGTIGDDYFDANSSGNLNISGSAEDPYAATVEYEASLLNSLNSEDISYTSDKIDSIKYLFGAPAQFTSTTDPRPEGSLLGRAYLSTMLSDMSMLVITPGKASFMSKFSNDFSNKVLGSLLGSVNDEEKSNLSAILNGKTVGRYYSFETDYTEYMKYVNNLCRLSAQLLGIGTHKLTEDSAEYWNMDWSINNFTNKGSGILSFLKQEPSVAFYIDGQSSSFSDGMSNSTDNSMFEGYMSSASSMSREMMFLFGKGYSDQALIDTSKTTFDDAVKKVMNSLTKNSNLLSTLSDRVNDHAATLINGGNIAFPEIWKDSSYSKSYSIEFKLVCPYGDVDSFFFHILVPIWHLLPLVYPRQLGANGYINPFLVRA